MSGRIKVLSPVVEEYSITISIPMELSVIITHGQNIYEAEEIFIRKRDRISDHSKKVELDRARAVLKYADTCYATLKDMHKESNKLKITLGFSSIENLVHFRDTMGSAVSSSTMD